MFTQRSQKSMLCCVKRKHDIPKSLFFGWPSADSVFFDYLEIFCFLKTNKHSFFCLLMKILLYKSLHIVVQHIQNNITESVSKNIYTRDMQLDSIHLTAMSYHKICNSFRSNIIFTRLQFSLVMASASSKRLFTMIIQDIRQLTQA